MWVLVRLYRTKCQQLVKKWGEGKREVWLWLELFQLWIPKPYQCGIQGLLEGSGRLLIPDELQCNDKSEAFIHDFYLLHGSFPHFWVWLIESAIISYGIKVCPLFLLRCGEKWGDKRYDTSPLNWRMKLIIIWKWMMLQCVSWTMF